VLSLGLTEEARLPCLCRSPIRGLLVENYRVQTTPCRPSRSTIFAGRHTQQTGLYLNSDTPLSGKPEAHRAIVRYNDQFFGAMPREGLVSWKRFNKYYYNCLRDVDRRSTKRLMSAIDLAPILMGWRVFLRAWRPSASRACRAWTCQA